MALAYHVNQKKVPESIKTVTEAQPKVRLIYRGNTYEYTPKLVKEPEITLVDSPSVTLIYRGATYTRKLPVPQPYQKPRALNWRWQQSS